MATAQKPAHFVGWTELGRTLYSSRKYKDAIPPLRKATVIQPELPANWVLLVNSLGLCQQWEEALATERAAASAIPDFVMPDDTLELLYLSRVRSAVERREWSIAAESYAHALDSFYANRSEIWFERAATRVLSDDESGYRKECAAMLEHRESAGLRKFLVARACTLGIVSVQELARASEMCLPELDQSADSYWSLTQRAALLCRKGKHREALPILEQAVESSTKPEHNIITWVWLSRVQLGLGNHDAAKLWLRKATSYLDQSTAKPEEMHLHNWLEAQILCREVETLLPK